MSISSFFISRQGAVGDRPSASAAVSSAIGPAA